MDDDYAEAVLDLVEQVPPGKVVTYGQLAEIVGARLGRGGPRIVGAVMMHRGGGVAWWRVVNAAGRPPAHLATEALRHLARESCPLAASGVAVDLTRARWKPSDGAPRDGVSDPADA